MSNTNLKNIKDAQRAAGDMQQVAEDMQQVAGDVVINTKLS